MEIEKLINWNAVSIFLTGDGNIIRSNYCPKKYLDVVDALSGYVYEWMVQQKGIGCVELSVKSDLPVAREGIEQVDKISSEKSKNTIMIDALKEVGNGNLKIDKVAKCGCWLDEKNQLRRPKDSSCNLYKSEHKEFQTL